MANFSRERYTTSDRVLTLQEITALESDNVALRIFNACREGFPNLREMAEAIYRDRGSMHIRLIKERLEKLVDGRIITTAKVSYRYCPTARITDEKTFFRFVYPCLELNAESGVASAPKEKVAGMLERFLRGETVSSREILESLPPGSTLERKLAHLARNMVHSADGEVIEGGVIDGRVIKRFYVDFRYPTLDSPHLPYDIARECYVLPFDVKSISEDGTVARGETPFGQRNAKLALLKGVKMDGMMLGKHLGYASVVLTKEEGQELWLRYAP